MEEFKQIPNEHQLWVNFSSLAEGNLFTQLTELITEMFESDFTDENSLEDDYKFTLSSDYEWRIGIYFKLLDKIRSENEMLVPWLDQEEKVKLHHWDILPKTTKVECTALPKKASKKDSLPLGPGPITWTVADISKAACLLDSPPKPIQFEDEQEMRRVYTLIYDTYRYKGILVQALNDISFFQLHPNIPDMNPRVWLLFFDLYHRSFRKRDPAVVNTAIKLFNESGVIMIEMALWEQRVKLAAAISRLRIKNSALRLHQLLPKHLRDNRNSGQGNACPVTCWINPHKTKNEEEVLKMLDKVLNLKVDDEAKEITPNTFKRDALCPHFVTFHTSQRTALAQCSLVGKHKLIVQDRSFCLGPATFGKIINDLELAGSVIQSHVNSPRTTAYLAMLLAKNSKIKNLLVFSAGHRKFEYESYFQDLGMKNVSIYSEKLIEISPDANCLDRVIAVFATPPNSYSAVSDPIDLVCSRGGDLSMLEALTESELTEEGKERVASILEEQRKTLRFAMSRPQIQLVLYETHSELEVENDVMVQKTIKEINKLAKIKHATLQGKVRMSSQSESIFKEINNNVGFPSDESTSRLSALSKISIVEPAESYENFYKDIIVPDCDLFDKPNLPDLCPNSDFCLKLSEEGCYLALLQRKEVTKLDNKYMINMAESRGLFASAEPAEQKNQRGQRNKKPEKRSASPTPKVKKKTKNIEIDRIAAPTHASNLKRLSGDKLSCQKHNDENDPFNKAMELLRSAAKGINEVSHQWDSYRINKSNEMKDYLSHDRPPRLTKFRPPKKVEDMSYLIVLEALTNSSKDLKDLVCCRVPCKISKTNMCNEALKAFAERNRLTMIESDSDEDLETPLSRASSRKIKAPNDKYKSSYRSTFIKKVSKNR